jgi:DNA-binding CsgD family transcriptional regulator
VRIRKPAGDPPTDAPALTTDVDRVNKTGEDTYDRAFAGLIERQAARVGERAIDTEMKARMAACIALSSQKMTAAEIADVLQLTIFQVRHALARARVEMTREQAFTDAITRVDRDIIPLAVDRLHEKVHEGKRWAIQDVLHGRRILQKQESKTGGGGSAAPGGGYAGPAVVINIVPNEKRPDVRIGTVIGQAKYDDDEAAPAALTIGLPAAASST